MKVKLIIFVLLFAGFKSHASQPLEVSIVSLISNPEKYDNQFVRVDGVSKLWFESNSIWLSKEHLKYRIHKNALWMALDFDRLGKTEEELAQYNGTYVLIEGVFNANSHGHMSLYSGAIEKISRFEPLEESNKTDKDPRNEDAEKAYLPGVGVLIRSKTGSWIPEKEEKKGAVGKEKEKNERTGPGKGAE